MYLRLNFELSLLLPPVKSLPNILKFDVIRDSVEEAPDLLFENEIIVNECPWSERDNNKKIYGKNKSDVSTLKLINEKNSDKSRNSQTQKVKIVNWVQQLIDQSPCITHLDLSRCELTENYIQPLIELLNNNPQITTLSVGASQFLKPIQKLLEELPSSVEKITDIEQLTCREWQDYEDLKRKNYSVNIEEAKKAKEEFEKAVKEIKNKADNNKQKRKEIQNNITKKSILEKYENKKIEEEDRFFSTFFENNTPVRSKYGKIIFNNSKELELKLITYYNFKTSLGLFKDCLTDDKDSNQKIADILKYEIEKSDLEKWVKAYNEDNTENKQSFTKQLQQKEKEYGKEKIKLIESLVKQYVKDENGKKEVNAFFNIHSYPIKKPLAKNFSRLILDFNRLLDGKTTKEKFDQTLLSCFETPTQTKLNLFTQEKFKKFGKSSIENHIKKAETLQNNLLEKLTPKLQEEKKVRDTIEKNSSDEQKKQKQDILEIKEKIKNFEGLLLYYRTEGNEGYTKIIEKTIPELKINLEEKEKEIKPLNTIQEIQKEIEQLEPSKKLIDEKEIKEKNKKEKEEIKIDDLKKLLEIIKEKEKIKSDVDKLQKEEIDPYKNILNEKSTIQTLEIKHTGNINTQEIFSIAQGYWECLDNVDCIDLNGFNAQDLDPEAEKKCIEQFITFANSNPEKAKKIKKLILGPFNNQEFLLQCLPTIIKCFGNLGEIEFGENAKKRDQTYYEYLYGNDYVVDKNSDKNKKKSEVMYEQEGRNTGIRFELEHIDSLKKIVEANPKLTLSNVPIFYNTTFQDPKKTFETSSFFFPDLIPIDSITIKNLKKLDLLRTEIETKATLAISKVSFDITRDYSSNGKSSLTIHCLNPSYELKTIKQPCQSSNKETVKPVFFDVNISTGSTIEILKNENMEPNLLKTDTTITSLTMKSSYNGKKSNLKRDIFYLKLALKKCPNLQNLDLTEYKIRSSDEEEMLEEEIENLQMNFEKAEKEINKIKMLEKKLEKLKKDPDQIEKSKKEAKEKITEQDEKKKEEIERIEKKAKEFLENTEKNTKETILEIKAVKKSYYYCTKYTENYPKKLEVFQEKLKELRNQKQNLLLDELIQNINKSTITTIILPKLLSEKTQTEWVNKIKKQCPKVKEVQCLLDFGKIENKTLDLSKLPMFHEEDLFKKIKDLGDKITSVVFGDKWINDHYYYGSISSRVQDSLKANSNIETIRLPKTHVFSEEQKKEVQKILSDPKNSKVKIIDFTYSTSKSNKETETVTLTSYGTKKEDLIKEKQKKKNPFDFFNLNNPKSKEEEEEENENNINYDNNDINYDNNNAL